MLTIGLCLLALLCVALGLRVDSAGWLIAAIVASVAALVSLVRGRGRQSAALHGTDGAAPDAVWVVDGRPRYHLRSCVLVTDWDPQAIPRTQAVEDGFVPCPVCGPDDALAA